MLDWNSNQYLMFGNERTQPAIDLVNRINLVNPEKVVDIGCGPGNSTAVLKRRFPDSYILGVDSSQNMIEAAREEYADIDFKICDAGKELSRLGNDFDIVFSNACIQWVPNHKELLGNMMNMLKKGGILAVQVPMNFQEPIHKIIKEVSSNDKWKSHFNNPRIFYTLTPEEYFDLLCEMSSEFDIWQTTYFHKMKSHEDIMNWYKGTGLRPYLNALEDSFKDDFEQDIRFKVVESYVPQKDGSIIFRFPRFFFIARK